MVFSITRLATSLMLMFATTSTVTTIIQALSFNESIQVDLPLFTNKLGTANLTTISNITFGNLTSKYTDFGQLSFGIDGLGAEVAIELFVAGKIPIPGGITASVSDVVFAVEIVVAKDTNIVGVQNCSFSTGNVDVTILGFNPFGNSLIKEIKTSIMKVMNYALQAIVCKKLRDSSTKMTTMLQSVDQKLQATISQLDLVQNYTPAAPPIDSKDITPLTFDDSTLIHIMDYLQDDVIGGVAGINHMVDTVTDGTGVVKINPSSLIKSPIDISKIMASAAAPKRARRATSPRVSEVVQNLKEVFAEATSTSTGPSFTPIVKFTIPHYFNVTLSINEIDISGLDTFTFLDLLSVGTSFIDNTNQTLQSGFSMKLAEIGLQLALDWDPLDKVQSKVRIHQVYNISGGLTDIKFLGDLFTSINSKGVSTLSTLQFLQPQCIFPQLDILNLTYLDFSANFIKPTFQSTSSEFDKQLAQFIYSFGEMVYAILFADIGGNNTMEIIVGEIIRPFINKEVNATINMGDIYGTINGMLTSAENKINGLSNEAMKNKLMNILVTTNDLLLLNSTSCVAAVNDPLEGTSVTPVLSTASIVLISVFSALAIIMIFIIACIEMGWLRNPYTVIMTRRRKNSKNNTECSESLENSDKNENAVAGAETTCKADISLGDDGILEEPTKTKTEIICCFAGMVHKMKKTWVLVFTGHSLSSLYRKTWLDFAHQIGIPLSLAMTFAIRVWVLTCITTGMRLSLYFTYEGVTETLVSSNIITMGYKVLVDIGMESGAWVGSVLITFSCLILPITKIAMLYVIWWSPMHPSVRSHSLQLLDIIGKYAFVDAIFLSFIIFILASTKAIGNDLLATIYCFPTAPLAGAVASTMIAYIICQYLKHINHHDRRAEHKIVKKDREIRRLNSQGNAMEVKIDANTNSNKLLNEQNENSLITCEETQMGSDNNSEDNSSTTNQVGKTTSNDKVVIHDDGLEDFPEERYWYSWIWFGYFAIILASFTVCYVMAFTKDLIRVDIHGVAGEIMAPENIKIMSLWNIPRDLVEFTEPEFRSYSRFIQICMYIALIVTPGCLTIGLFALLLAPVSNK
eukprot:Pgem_evm1s1824